MLIDYVYSIQTIRATEAEARTEPLNHHKHPLTEVRRLVLPCHRQSGLLPTHSALLRDEPILPAIRVHLKHHQIKKKELQYPYAAAC